MVLAAILVAALAACSDEQQQVQVTPQPVDILWIVDSSNSMAGNQADLATAIPSFVDTLDTSAVDYQLGVTTTQAHPCDQDPDAYEGCHDAVGTGGRLRGLANSEDDTSSPPTILRAADPSVASDFQALVDVGVDGSNMEYGLWTAALAICASLDLPFDTDFDSWDTDTPYECSGTNWDTSHDWADFCRCLPPELRDYNADTPATRFLRDDAALMIVVVSDEGDATPRLGNGSWPWDLSGCALADPWPQSIQDRCAPDPAGLCANYCKIDRFLEFFDSLGRDVVVATISVCADLSLDDEWGAYLVDTCCNDQNPSDEDIEFYLLSPEFTGGAYYPIDLYEDGTPCAEDSVGPAMVDLAQLVIQVSEGS
jgi:hypothetical protein